jgi:hypothetical protein
MELLIIISIIIILLFLTKSYSIDKKIFASHLCLIGILYFIYAKNKIDLNDKENRKFPFRYFRDANHKILPVVALTAFFRSDEDKKLYYRYINSGINVFGITAYKSFPKKIDDISEDKYHLTDNFDYLKNIKNWLCCFKNVEHYGFTKEHHIMDISESDFYNIDEKKEEKKYDFIYICNKDNVPNCPINGWNAINRNFDLALKCFPIMCNVYKLKGLVVGRIGCGLEKTYPSIETTDFLEWPILQTKMRQSKFLFVPNIMDASPRVVTECLTKNIPVLMNSNILCGTKYINEMTGELFTSENDIENVLKIMLEKINDGRYNTIDFWNQFYGTERSATLLYNFIKSSFNINLGDVTKIYFLL